MNELKCIEVERFSDVPPLFFEKKKSNTFCRFDKKYNLNFTPNVVIGGQKVDFFVKYQCSISEEIWYSSMCLKKSVLITNSNN